LPERELHRLLRRQLHRNSPGALSDDPAFRQLVADVDRAYREADDQQALMERSLEMTSQELLQRAQELRDALAASGVATWGWNPASDEAICEGYPHPLHPGKPGRCLGARADLLAAVAPEHQSRFLAALDAAIHEGRGIDVRLRTADGRWVVLRGRVQPTPRGQVITGTCADVTGEMAAEVAAAAQRERSERLARVLVELATRAADDRDDLKRALERVTESVGEVLGVERTSVWLLAEDQASLNLVDVWRRGPRRHEGGAELRRADYPVFFDVLDDVRVLAADDARQHEFTREFDDGYLDALGIRSMLTATIRGEGRVVGVVCHAHVGEARVWTAEEQSFAAAIADLIALIIEGTRRREAEAAQEKQRVFLRQVVDINPTLIFAKDRDGRFTLANQAVAEIYGTTIDDLVGRSDADFNSNQAEVEHFLSVDRQVIDSGQEHFVAEERITDAGGRVHWLQTVKRPIRSARGDMQILGVATDITERKRAEESRAALESDLRQAQRIQSIGLLAGGVAHDFNNMLMPILLSAEMLRADRAPDDPVAEEAQEILNAAHRASELTKQLLAFGRKQVLRMSNLCPNEEVRRIVRMLKRLVPEHIQLQTRLDPSVGCISADPNQLGQVFMNLATNARDAMPQGGTLTISTQRMPGGRVRLVVSDTGCGMSEQTAARVFEPFFTTKEPGRGTGLGLATVHGIVAQHGGTIRVDSSLGAGTSFEIEFPEVALPPDAPGVESFQGDGRGEETVLLVDDDLVILRLVSRTLEGAGYRVLSAGHPEDALRVAKEHAGNIDLVVTDIGLPRMNGLDLYERVAVMNPQSRVLYMSGYTHDLLGTRGRPLDLRCFLAKPFSPAQLTRAIREVLE
jgi:PAS domain S-box-containing protein